jgi:hypothetical protein
LLTPADHVPKYLDIEKIVADFGVGVVTPLGDDVDLIAISRRHGFSKLPETTSGTVQLLIPHTKLEARLRFDHCLPV